MRTALRASLVDGRAKNSSARRRASSFRAGGTESSRSTMAMSAPDRWLLVYRSTAVAGVDSRERQYRVNFMEVSEVSEGCGSRFYPTGLVRRRTAGH